MSGRYLEDFAVGQNFADIAPARQRKDG